jgi:hypothetical protein
MRRLVQVLLLGAIALGVAYWSVWFTDRRLIASENSPAYYEFENAFPLADAWLGVACLLAFVALQRRRPSALFWLLCAGGAGVYLFCMDLLYDLENGIFAQGSGGVVEAFIVGVTLLFSVTILAWTWRHRAELLSGDDAGCLMSRDPEGMLG